MINKHYLTFMLLLLCTVLSSCGSDDDGMDSVKPVTPPASGTSWTVDVVAETTRGLAESGDVLTQSWSTTDNIFVYYKNLEVGVLHPETGGNSGVVKLLGNIDTPATPYVPGGKLFFCYRHHKDFSDYSGQDGTLETIASDYDFATAEANIKTVNENERKLTVELASFKSQQAIVKFTFKQGDANNGTIPDKPVKSVTVSSGALSNDITINSSSATNVLYVALPVSSTTDVPYYITTIDGNDNPDFVGKLPSIALQKGKYYTSEVRLYEAVQLWEGGPMWAKKNVDNISNGLYYQWGGTTGSGSYDYFVWANNPDYKRKTSEKRYTTATAPTTLWAEDDAANKRWGKACRMPTNADFDDLIAYTTCTWKTGSDPGATFTGKDAYSNKSIFLPAKGFITGSNTSDPGIKDKNMCYYWSSSCFKSGDELFGGGLSISAVNYNSPEFLKAGGWAARYQGMKIRAIIDWK